MRKRRAKPSGKDKHPFEGSPFVEGLFDWMDSPAGQHSIEALDLVFGELDHVDVDAQQRKIVWTDGKRLSIEEAAERLHADHPDIPRDLIEDHVFGWLENCAPESYSEQQLEEFDRLMEPWLEDYERKQPAAGK
jgi:hypothetical protein